MKDSFIIRPPKPRIIKLGKAYMFIDSKPLRKQVNAKVKEINENSVLPAPVLSEFSYENRDSLFPECEFIDNYMSFDFYAADYFISFSGYPTDENESRLTTIRLTTDKYSIYGISVGMMYCDADKIMKSFGFPKSTDSDKCCYSFPDIKIFFSVLNGIITQTDIEIGTYYVGNKIY